MVSTPGVGMVSVVAVVPVPGVCLSLSFSLSHPTVKAKQTTDAITIIDSFLFMIYVFLTLPVF